MPRGDGTGPGGFGPGAGGRGFGGGNRPGAGPGGYCICPSCKAKIEHQRGVPCYQVNCPKCGAKMVRG